MTREEKIEYFTKRLQHRVKDISTYYSGNISWCEDFVIECMDQIVKAPKTYTVDCPTCKGNRWIRLDLANENINCPECDGSGEIQYVDEETVHDNKTSEMEERERHIQGTLDCNGFVLR